MFALHNSPFTLIAQLQCEEPGGPNSRTGPSDLNQNTTQPIPHGKLHYGQDNASGDHIIAVLSEKVSDYYLTELREDGVSYLFAGPDGSDLSGALEKLGKTFGLQKLLLEGGVRINEAFLKEGLIARTRQGPQDPESSRLGDGRWSRVEPPYLCHKGLRCPLLSTSYRSALSASVSPRLQEATQTGRRGSTRTISCSGQRARGSEIPPGSW